jgi:hypothetical protein
VVRRDDGHRAVIAEGGHGVAGLGAPVALTDSVGVGGSVVGAGADDGADGDVSGGSDGPTGGPAEAEPVVPGPPAGVVGFLDGEAPGDVEAEASGLGEADTLGVVVAVEPGDAAPDGWAAEVSDGDVCGRGTLACRAGGSAVDTPGWRIGAIGGRFGSGSGVTPDTHA